MMFPLCLLDGASCAQVVFYPSILLVIQSSFFALEIAAITYFCRPLDCEIILLSLRSSHDHKHTIA